MSLQYSAIKWNHNKKMYDLAIAAGIALYVGTFVGIGSLIWQGSVEVLLIRALGTCGILMLHLVLSIGPLARLDRRVLPLLYNRRHLGVATFLVGFAHAVLTTGYYHGFGRVNPLLSLLTSNTNFSSWRAFPFELLGIGGLLILFVLAVTSHDFWQKNLGASCWKTIHMAVYVAYGLLVMHVVLGALQSERSPIYALLVVAGAIVVITLQLGTGLREWRRDDRSLAAAVKPVAEREETWIDVAAVDDIAECRAIIVTPPGGERVAIFRYDGRVSAVTNVCAHQRGPLGEGKIVDGCITCPWHGWEYRPRDGCSPPPFAERITTYRVRVRKGRVLLNPQPLLPGTSIEPAVIEESQYA